MSEITMSVVSARTTVHVEELAEWIEKGPAPMILDVRQARAFMAGHAPEAESAPASYPASLVERIPSDGLVVLICDDGSVSRQIVSVLRMCGCRCAVSLEGGMRRWVASGYETVAEAGVQEQNVADLLQEVAA